VDRGAWFRNYVRTLTPLIGSEGARWSLVATVGRWGVAAWIPMLVVLAGIEVMAPTHDPAGDRRTLTHVAVFGVCIVAAAVAWLIARIQAPRAASRFISAQLGLPLAVRGCPRSPVGWQKAIDAARRAR